MEESRHLSQASCSSKGTWLFGAFAMFSTGKSDVKVMVGRMTVQEQRIMQQSMVGSEL